jgi:uncharacterized protein YigA (DUF484 family)
MSKQADSNDNSSGDQEQLVVDYLDQQPDFFARHPELLVNLEVPHGAGGASLLEYQVSVLRDKNKRYSSRLDEYHETAESNARLLRRIHDLYIVMLDASDASDLLAKVHKALAERFKCDAAAIALYQDPVPEGAVSLASSEALKTFAGLRERPEPAVGRLARAKMDLLFDAPLAESLNSVALAPLDESGQLGLLVLASQDEHRYHPGMGTLFIDLVGRMLGESLKRLG